MQFAFFSIYVYIAAAPRMEQSSKAINLHFTAVHNEMHPTLHISRKRSLIVWTIAFFSVVHKFHHDSGIVMATGQRRVSLLVAALLVHGIAFACAISCDVGTWRRVLLFKALWRVSPPSGDVAQTNTLHILLPIYCHPWPRWQRLTTLINRPIIVWLLCSIKKPCTTARCAITSKTYTLHPITK